MADVFAAAKPLGKGKQALNSGRTKLPLSSCLESQMPSVDLLKTAIMITATLLIRKASERVQGSQTYTAYGVQYRRPSTVVPLEIVLGT